jgi:long-chain acyl-CoA synthetase
MGQSVTSGHAPAFQERASRYRSVCEAFQAAVAERADAPALAAFGDERSDTWREVGAAVERLAGSLTALGVSRGDTVGLMLRNRPQFNLLDAAVLHLGAVPWSIYLTSSAEQVRVFLSGAESRVVIGESDLMDTIQAAAAETAVEHVIDIAELESLPPAPDGFDFENVWRSVESEDVLTIIWTSGTTGAPKPVELTHGAMLTVLDAMTTVTGVGSGGRLLSVLPSAHVGDRWSAHCWWMTLGAELTCVSDASQLMAATAAVRPTIWGSVPRVWEKLRAALEAKGITAPAAMTAEARQAVRASLGLADAEVFIVGAAPLGEETLKYFEDLGLPICELWGMSESTGVLTLNPPSARRIGTVGLPLPGVEVRLAADGEILARGPMLMRGYRGRPDLTAEALVDGWLQTGDVGQLDDDGYLTIIDRKKELIINSAGKNMSPVAIEAALKTAGPLIGQACAVGDRRPYVTALLVLDADALGAWARANGKADSTYRTLCSDPDVLRAVRLEVESANARLSRVEQLKTWHVMDADWLADSDELTPTMKLRRRPIATKYATLIDDMYVTPKLPATANAQGARSTTIQQFQLSQKDFGRFGTGLARPECVWIDSDGIWASDARGGIALVSFDGEPTILGSGIGTPNGFSRRANGAFLVAGLDDATVYEVTPNGDTSVLLENVDGRSIGAANYPCSDGDRTWISIMTTDSPWDEALRGPAKGQILLLDAAGAHVVADDLHLTNEVKVSPDGRFLYAAESRRCRIVRFPIRDDGSLGDREIVGPEHLGDGAFPDGFTFDGDGNIWVTIICRNGLYVITADGDLHVVYEDVNEPALGALLAATAEDRATVEMMGACATAGPLILPTSLAFGGVDGRDAYVGSLAFDHLVTFRSPVPGI